MESFFEVVVVFFGIIISLFVSAKKAKNRRVTEAARQAASPVKPKPAEAKPTHPYTSAQPTVMQPMPFGDIPGQVIAPTVHAHVRSDCETHDAPGSLGVATTEGKDPCHEPQLTHARSFSDPVQEESGLTFDWSGENMVKAFVMQEVLTRPCQRRTR